MATIGGNLFTRHPKNLNHVHKYSNDLLSLIIILGRNVHGCKIVFYGGFNMNDIGKRAHFLKHSHARCVVGSFDKNLHEGYIWTGHRAVLNLHEGSIWNGHRAVLYFIFHKLIFLHFVHHGTIFYGKYITSDDRNRYMYNYGSGIFPKKVKKIYNAKYQKTYSNRYYVLNSDYINYTRTRRTYPGIKRRTIGFVYLKGSQYCYAEGSSHLRSCLHDAIINSAQG